MKTKIVCFCGSTRFAQWFMTKRWELEKQEIITLGINILPGNEIDFIPCYILVRLINK